jgi:hypothetical protein
VFLSVNDKKVRQQKHNAMSNNTLKNGQLQAISSDPTAQQATTWS